MSKLLQFALTVPRLAWLWVATLAPFRKPMQRLDHYCGIYQPEDLAPLSHDIDTLMHMDLYLRFRMGCPEAISRGHKAWEYALGVNYWDSVDGMEVLDVGAGNSTYPVWFAKHGASVTTFDLPDPSGRPLWWSSYKLKRHGIPRVHGNMLELPFDDSSFDLVVCASVIEHLNFEPKPSGWYPVTNQQFYERTSQTLRELCRVVRPGGCLYITTDLFLPSEGELGLLKNPTAEGRRNGYAVCELKKLWFPILAEARLDPVQPREISEEFLRAVVKRDGSPTHHKRPFAMLAKKREAE